MKYAQSPSSECFHSFYTTLEQPFNNFQRLETLLSIVTKHHILQEHLAVISLFKGRGDYGPCAFLPVDFSRHSSLWADLTVSL